MTRMERTPPPVLGVGKVSKPEDLTLRRADETDPAAAAAAATATATATATGPARVPVPRGLVQCTLPS